MDIKVLKINENATIPTPSEDHIGFDLYACLEKGINLITRRSRDIQTGIQLRVPDGYYGMIFIDETLAKKGVRIEAGVTIYSNDKCGQELRLSLFNNDNQDHTIKHGEKIAKLILVPYVDAGINAQERIKEKVSTEPVQDNQFTKWKNI